MKRIGLVFVLAVGFLCLLGASVSWGGAAAPPNLEHLFVSPTPGATTSPEPSPTLERPGVVRMLMFYAPTCPHCHDIITNYFPELWAKYRDKIEAAALNVEDAASYGLLLAIEAQANIPEDRRGAVPVIVVGKYIFIGAGSIRDRLEGAIDEYLAQGGVDYPIPSEYLAEVTATPKPTTEAATPTGQPAASASPTSSPVPTPKPIAVAYFYEVGCRECDRVTYDINYLKSLYPQLQADVFDVTEHAALNEWLCEQYGLPPSKRLLTPIVFIGDDYLLEGDVTLKNIEALIQRYASTGAEARWREWDPNKQEEVSRQIVARFRSMGVFTVALAALVDGLNPCAFATLILFVSYLALTGRKGRQILLVGFAFALGVFVTYLLVGVGILKFLAALPMMKTIGRWIYGGTAVLCLVLAVLSILDYFKARRGRAEAMSLRLPLRLRRWVNRVVRESMGSGAFALTALVAGFLVSLIELACTGQVYLPTIVFVLGVPEMQAQALVYLVLYNLVFVLPLVVVFVLAYFGTTSEKLTLLLNRHTATIKLATAGLFLLLAAGLAFYVV